MFKALILVLTLIPSFAFAELPDDDFGNERLVEFEVRTYKIDPSKDELCKAALKVKNPTAPLDKKILNEMVARFNDSGDRAIRDRVTMSYTLMAWKIAKRECGMFGIEFIEDCVQEGLMMVERAMTKFDFSKNVSFTTYVVPWIRSGITRYKTLKARTVTVTNATNLQTLEGRIKRLSAKLSKEGKRELLTPEYIAETLKVTVFNVENVFKMRSASRSANLHDTIPGSEDLTFEAITPSRHLSPEESLERAEALDRAKQILMKFAEELNERERAIFFERLYPVHEGEIPTLEVLGKRYKISRERIRQLESQLKQRLLETFGTELAAVFVQSIDDRNEF